jgi:hypothetical protein
VRWEDTEPRSAVSPQPSPKRLHHPAVSDASASASRFQLRLVELLVELDPREQAIVVGLAHDDKIILTTASDEHRVILFVTQSRNLLRAIP